MRSRIVRIVVGEQKPDAADSKPAQALWRQHFATILSTLATAITGVIGFFFVTVYNRDADERKVVFDQMVKVQSMELELRKENFQGAEDARKFVPALLGGTRDDVENAAISLAVGGSTNVEFIVAVLANPRINTPIPLVEGLKIAAIKGHDQTCDTLCRYAIQPTVAQSTRVSGNLAVAFNKLRCTEARPLLERWSKATDEVNPNITDAVDALKPETSDPPARTNSPCPAASAGRSP